MELTSELSVKLIGCQASDEDVIDGSYEHNFFWFHIVAPIFVLREIHQYHVNWSYTEVVTKGVDNPKFYVPLRVVQQTDIHIHLRNVYHESYKEYETMLEKGIPKTIARMCLPVGLYSSMYVTCNAHLLMSFLSIRKDMWEVQQISDRMGEFFAWAMPLTHHAFVENGYVAL